MGDVRMLLKRLSLPEKSQQLVASKALEFYRISTARLGPSVLGQVCMNAYMIRIPSILTHSSSNFINRLPFLICVFFNFAHPLFFSNHFTLCPHPTSHPQAEVARAAICVDLACMSLNISADTTPLKLASGTTSLLYKNARVMLQKVLNIRMCTTSRELCIQFGCHRIEALLRATVTSFRSLYLDTLPPAERATVSPTLLTSNPKFLGAIFFLVARRNKVKINREHVMASLGLSSSEFNKTVALVVDVMSEEFGEDSKSLSLSAGGSGSGGGGKKRKSENMEEEGEEDKQAKKTKKRRMTKRAMSEKEHEALLRGATCACLPPPRTTRSMTATTTTTAPPILAN